MIKRTLIIAEAGVNHNGDILMAKQLIDAAAHAGADLVKFQTFNASRQVTRVAKKADYQTQTTDGKESQHDMLQRLELTEAMHHELITHCAKRSIGFFSTGFDIESIDLLLGLGQVHFKIPSGEITNLPYLQHLGQVNKIVILSTGMSSLGDIEAAILYAAIARKLAGFEMGAHIVRNEAFDEHLWIVHGVGHPKRVAVQQWVDAPPYEVAGLTADRHDPALNGSLPMVYILIQGFAKVVIIHFGARPRTHVDPHHTPKN
jgi:N,N'-diacetyllegionaminate synthase